MVPSLQAKPQTAAQRRAKADAKQRALGRAGRKVWATDEEHKWINEQLANRRGEE